MGQGMIAHIRLLAFYAAPAAALLSAIDATAVTVSREVTVNLDDLSYIPNCTVYGHLCGELYVSIDPFSLSIGDSVETTIDFGKRRVQLVNQESDVQPGLAIEHVQVWYLGPYQQGAWVYSSHQLSLIDPIGNYIGSDPWQYPQEFGCGNCLVMFSSGDLTPTQFQFHGLEWSATVTRLGESVQPYSLLLIQFIAGDVRLRPVHEPGTLVLLGLGLVGLGWSRRRTT